MSPTRYPFPKQYRLTKTDEFSSVFGFRRAIKSTYFLLHWREPGPEGGVLPDRGPRLGVVVGKKQARFAHDRNLVKRLTREAFRLRRGALPTVDMVLRLGVSLDKANPRPNRRQLAGEIVSLLERLSRKLSGGGLGPGSPAPRFPRKGASG